MPIVVEILSGARRGQRAVLEKPLVTLGRHPDNDIVFDERSEGLVSAFHAELHEIGPGRWVLDDRGSSNGTWVAGSRVTELAFEGRLEVQLAHDGPRVALMPLTVVPAQAADALATPGAMPRPTVPAGIDPLVVAPTMDGPHAGYRGPGRIGAASAERTPAKGSPASPLYPSAPERPGATEAGGGPGSDVPPWQRTVSSAGPTVGSAMGRPPITTAQIRAVAGDMVRRSSRRFGVVVAVLSLLLLGTGVMLALVLTGTVPLGGGGGGRGPGDGRGGRRGGDPGAQAVGEGDRRAQQGRDLPARRRAARPRRGVLHRLRADAADSGHQRALREGDAEGLAGAG
jgi:pSer/pThr/pTyr-binding forkhead associated (FHA) protein